MKKNVLSIIIIALLIVNIVLTSIMMISMMGTNKKTADLVSDIAAVLSLELEAEGEIEIPMSQQSIWTIAETMTIHLQSEKNYDDAGNVTATKDHYVAFNISFALDMEGEGYEEYGVNIANYESMVKDAITTTVSKHTVDECRNNFDMIKEEILADVSALFDKKFIYKVAVDGLKFQ